MLQLILQLWRLLSREQAQSGFGKSKCHKLRAAMREGNISWIYTEPWKRSEIIFFIIMRSLLSNFFVADGAPAKTDMNL